MAEMLGRSTTLVVVDNDDAVRSLMVRALGRYDYAFAEVAETWQALNYFEWDLPADLLITDLNPLSVLSGAQLANRVHAMRPNLPVLIVSGAHGEQIGEPNTALLHKPFRIADFLDLVQRCLRSAG